MKTMIVIDDEYLVRLGIRETIDWASHGFTIVGEAVNGRAGLELIEKVRPDIVISDVKMPFLDGVELVKTLQTRKCDLAVVILSGFKDFDFAKGALEHGAAQYLLKPIDNDELVAAVRRAADMLDRRRELAVRARVAESELPAIRRHLLETLAKGPAGCDLPQRLVDAGIAVPERGRVLYGAVDEPKTYPDSAVLAAATAALADALLRHGGTAASAIVDGACFAVAAETLDDRAWKERLLAALAEFEASHSEIVSLSVSAPFAGIAGIPEAFAAARAVAMNKFFPAVSTVSVPSEAGVPWRPLVVRAMELIAGEYGTDLTVRSVVDRLYVSESYLLHAFRKDTGTTFNDALTNYRMAVAKRLLSENRFKVYEVAARVGYADEKYFSTVFRKRVGMTPSDYAARGGVR